MSQVLATHTGQRSGSRRWHVWALVAVGALLVLLALPAVSGAAPAADRYIVVLKERVDDPGSVAAEHGRRFGVERSQLYRHALNGYAGKIPSNRVDSIRTDDRVAYVERDSTVEASAQTLPWGIDRIDADGSSTRAGDGTGAVGGVTAYVIDTGIDRAHSDLNVVGHVNFAGGKNRDCNGHGTHVAGTVAARDNAQDVVGAAPGALLVGVKVLGCSGSGSTSGVIKGVDWVTQNAVKPAVANMSLGGSPSQALDDAVKRSADGGVFYSVAAGNEGAIACSSSPARAGTHEGVMTTAATNQLNQETPSSNYGACVDLWAPGASILSTRKGGGTKTMSGTSMAAPHVGGTGALYLPSHPGSSAAAVEDAVKDAAALRPTGTTSKNGAPIQLDYAGDF